MSERCLFSAYIPLPVIDPVANLVFLTGGISLVPVIPQVWVGSHLHCQVEWRFYLHCRKGDDNLTEQHHLSEYQLITAGITYLFLSGYESSLKKWQSRFEGLCKRSRTCRFCSCRAGCSRPVCCFLTGTWGTLWHSCQSGTWVKNSVWFCHNNEEEKRKKWLNALVSAVTHHPRKV